MSDETQPQRDTSSENGIDDTLTVLGMLGIASIVVLCHRILALLVDHDDDGGEVIEIDDVRKPRP